jgi:hypothetical protein
VPCTLSFDATLSRVRVDATSIGGTVTHATVERSDDGGSTFKFVRGGLDVPVSSGATQLVTDDYEFTTGHQLTYRVRGYNSSDALVTTFTCTITVNQDEIWLKSVERPFLNQPLGDCVLNPFPAGRAARQGILEVIDRSFPVAVTDVRAGVEYDLIVVTRTYEEQLLLDYLLASGDVVYLQPTATFPQPAMFGVLGDTVAERPLRNRRCDEDYRRFRLPFTQVAPPDADVVGHTATWYTVVVTYQEWNDVIAAHATWADLLENLVGEPDQVIRP